MPFALDIPFEDGIHQTLLTFDISEKKQVNGKLIIRYLILLSDAKVRSFANLRTPEDSLVTLVFKRLNPLILCYCLIYFFNVPVLVEYCW